MKIKQKHTVSIKKLAIRLTIKVVIVIVLGVLFHWHMSCLDPHYRESDIYNVSGTCIDIHIEGNGGKYGGIRRYIVLDNGEKYFIRGNLVNYMGFDDVRNLKGQSLSFYASDKSIFWAAEHIVVALNSNPLIKEKTLAQTNKDNLEIRIAMMVLYGIAGAAYLVPDNLRIGEIRSKERERVWAQQRKTKKKLKYQALKEKQSSETKHQNTSFKEKK